jgi:tRNA-specific 2-thiouridylase
MSKKVYIAMSGGVDSAGAALLLQRQGYDVAGVTLRLHHCADRPGLCGGSEELESAAQAARTLGIPHTVLDLCDLFRTEVMDHFVSEYRAGRTPNPCIDCNRAIKFGALLDWVLEQGGDYLATGHYARVSQDPQTGRRLLLRGRDPKKDQSYVLYQLTQRQLAHLLLPVGEYEKPAIRQLAAERGLANAGKPDSEDICFVPDGDYMNFLETYGGVRPVPGPFVDEGGRVLGRHRGLERYTTGQRKGLGVSAGTPVYVLRKDQAQNAVVLGPDSALFRRELVAGRVNWISVAEPGAPLRVTAKTRYSQNEAAATVESLGNGEIHVTFDEPQRAITAGQAVVLYDGERIVGGGTIEEREFP